MPLPNYIEGRVASLTGDNPNVLFEGTVTIEQITTNNTILATGEVTGVSKDTQTTIVTVPANGVKYVTKIICTGEENARWDVYINGARKITKRTIDRTVDFDFPVPLKVQAATVIDVKATHHGPDASADFQACVLGYLEV